MKKSSLLLFAFIAASSPQATFAQALKPDLGITASYALFTAAGAIINTGVTIVTGDVGNDAGAFVGFPGGTGTPTGVINGETHIQDSVAHIANLHVHAADSFLSSLATDDTLTAVALGSGQVVLPGVHKVGAAPLAAASLNDTLFLDGQGDSNAVFIFKITGAFVTGTASQVVAINSASLKNVYWQIAGQVDLGSASQFGGTIIANDAIIFGPAAGLTGRALGLASAFTLNNNIVTNPEASTFGPFNPLSLNFVKLSVEKQGTNALLKWTTGNQTGTATFTAERSTDGTAASWKPIGKVVGTSTTSDFSLIDNNVTLGANYYRLRVTSPDGSSSLSNIEQAFFNAAHTPVISAYPNPVKNSFTVAGATPGSTIMVMDMAGRVLISQAADASGANLVPSSHLAPGAYLLKVLSKDGSTITAKLSK